MDSPWVAEIRPPGSAVSPSIVARARATWMWLRRTKNTDVMGKIGANLLGRLTHEQESPPHR